MITVDNEIIDEDNPNNPKCLYCNNESDAPIILKQQQSNVEVMMCSDYCAMTLEECDQGFIRL